MYFFTSAILMFFFCKYIVFFRYEMFCQELNKFKISGRFKFHPFVSPFQNFLRLQFRLVSIIK